MNDYEKNHLRNKLLREIEYHNNILSLQREYGFQNAMKDSTGELSSYDNHPADLASESFELDKQFALNRHQSQKLIEAKEALARMDVGDYGFCKFCGKEIDFDRLDALPTAEECIDCEEENRKAFKNKNISRPVEEDVLKTPFARTFTAGENVAYDGEDAWQDVQEYGSSSGPKDFSVNELIDYNNAWYDSDENSGRVEDIENISNETYKKQLPDSDKDT
jgi:YteA family regulatory protein